MTIDYGIFLSCPPGRKTQLHSWSFSDWLCRFQITQYRCGYYKLQQLGKYPEVTIPIKITTFFLELCLKSCYFLCRSTSAIPSANTPAYADDDAAGSVGTATSAWHPAHHAAASRSAAGQRWYRRGCQSLWSAQMIRFWLHVMHSNKSGNKSHRPVLRYGQLKLA